MSTRQQVYMREKKKKKLGRFDFREDRIGAFGKIFEPSVRVMQ